MVRPDLTRIVGRGTLRVPAVAHPMRRCPPRIRALRSAGACPPPPGRPTTATSASRIVPDALHPLDLHYGSRRRPDDPRAQERRSMKFTMALALTPPEHYLALARTAD